MRVDAWWLLLAFAGGYLLMVYQSLTWAGGAVYFTGGEMHLQVEQTIRRAWHDEARPPTSNHPEYGAVNNGGSAFPPAAPPEIIEVTELLPPLVEEVDDGQALFSLWQGPDIPGQPVQGDGQGRKQGDATALHDVPMEETGRSHGVTQGEVDDGGHSVVDISSRGGTRPSGLRPPPGLGLGEPGVASVATARRLCVESEGETPCIIPGARLTYYLPTGARTRSGTWPFPGVAAGDPDVLPIGTIVRLASRYYVILDTGSGVRGAWLDAYFPNAEEGTAWQAEVGQYGEIEVLQWGSK